MYSTHDSNTTPFIMALDIFIPISIILFITGIAPGLFIGLLGFVLVGVIFSTVWECCKLAGKN